MSNCFRLLSFQRSNADTVKFFVDPKSGFNDSTSFDALNRFFDPVYLQEYALDIATKGGRGQTLLYTLEHKYIGAIYGPKKDLLLPVAVPGVNSASSLATSTSSASTTATITSSASTMSGASANPAAMVAAGESLSGTASAGGAEAGQTPKSSGRCYYPLCLRAYWRGGMIGKWLKRGYFRFSHTAARAQQEFELTYQLFHEGLPVPRPLIAREKVGWLFVQNDLLLEQIPFSLNLAEILARRGTLSDKEIALVAQSLKSLFKAGVYHSDLNIRNILICTPPEALSAAPANATSASATTTNAIPANAASANAVPANAAPTSSALANAVPANAAPTSSALANAAPAGVGQATAGSATIALDSPTVAVPAGFVNNAGVSDVASVEAEELPVTSGIPVELAHMTFADQATTAALKEVASQDESQAHSSATVGASGASNDTMGKANDFDDLGCEHSAMYYIHALAEDFTCPKQVQCYIIDFDKCSRQQPLKETAYEEMLSRLQRSFTKEQSRYNYPEFDVEATMSALRASINA